MTLLATVSGERRGANAIARVEGEIDASNVWWVAERLRAPLTNRCEGLAVDLTGTTYLDSAGIAMLFELAKALQQHQQQLRLVISEGSSIARMVGLAGLDSAIPTHPSLEAALAEAGGAMTKPDFDRILVGGREGGRVRLVPYRAEWPERFARERARLAAALGATAELIEHVGSTSVPGLDAKPIVDILVAVARPDDPSVRAALEGAGYVLRVDEGAEHQMFRTPERDVHVHLWVAGSREVTRHLEFRDRLLASDADRDAYARLKHRLAEREWDDINDYAEAKGPMIGEILERARGDAG